MNSPSKCIKAVHTVILESFNMKELGLFNFAFQPF